MSFELVGSKPDDVFFEHKAPEGPEEEFTEDMAVHEDLFETISEAHYLPELGGPHDEALLESLVEKGCEDNQILGQALDKLAHLVHGTGEYQEEEEDMLLGDAPVSDIIDRLEQSLESPGRSSMSAAQGLLNLHNIGDHLPPPTHQPPEQTYIPDEVFEPQEPSEATQQTLNSESETIEPVEYDNNTKNTLQNRPEPVPDTHDTYDKKFDDDQQPQAFPDQSEGVVNSESLGIDSACENDVSKPDDVIEPKTEIDDMYEAVTPAESDDLKDDDDCEEVATDLSLKSIKKKKPVPPVVVASAAETTNATEDNISDKSDEQPKDQSYDIRLPTPHASPRRIETPRAPSRESDAMQSPQPSGIPAVPSSPEIFTMPHTKSKQTLFLETLLSSPSPKMYTSEVTITKQPCEPVNRGKHRKSASPTVSSCSDDIRKVYKEFGEPHEKRLRRESIDDLVKICKVFNPRCNDQLAELIKNRVYKPTHLENNEPPPMKQLAALKSNRDLMIPDPLLVPKERLNDLLCSPGREIPTLVVQYPDMRLPEAFSIPGLLSNPDILVISLSHLETLLLEDEDRLAEMLKNKEIIINKKVSTKTSSSAENTTASKTDAAAQPKPIPSMDAMADDIDAASAAINQMIWLPYISQIEAMTACSQNMDFLKALSSSGYTGPNYPDLSQMLNPSARFMGPSGFPMGPQMDYNNRLQFAMWQEAMNNANASAAQRNKPSTLEAQMKELASKSSDIQNPYVHSTKNNNHKTHTSARTSPIAHNYNTNQRMDHNPFLQGMYPGMNPNIRPNMPLPGLQIPYFNPNMMGTQRSTRTGQLKSPTSPYYPNNNYLQSMKQAESRERQRSSSSSSQESPRPRISVRSLQNLLEPSAAVTGGRRASSSGQHRRRDEPEVGSTTPLGEPAPHLPPHPTDPSSIHLWHPLFGNLNPPSAGQRPPEELRVPLELDDGHRNG